MAALYLQTACGEERILDRYGDPILEPNEVMIPSWRRREAERLLAENCHSTATWYALARVITRDDDVHRAFAEAYAAVTGFSANIRLTPMGG